MYLATKETKKPIFYAGGLKSSYEDVISAADDLLDQWDPKTARPMEEVCGPQERLCCKVNLI